MKATAKNLLKIAEAEVGYREKATNSQLDSKTANAGSGNYTKYARDLAAAGYYNGNKNGYSWCDVFVDWCFYQLCGRDAKAAQAMECQTGSLGAGVGYSARYYKNQGRYFKTPQPGDQIFFGTDHTGLVVAVGSTWVETIEGNSNNRVERRRYALTDRKIDGYGRPKFDEEDNDMSKFIDVADSAWYAKAVDFCADKGLMSGTGSGKFEPNAALTRAEAATIMMRLYQAVEAAAKKA